MIITDYSLLSDLHELDGSRFLDYLKERRENAVKESINARSDRECNIAVGKIRDLDDIINDIKTAQDVAMKMKEEQANKSAIKKANMF